MSTLKERLEQHLFKTISTQIERIAYVPADLEKIARNIESSSAPSPQHDASAPREQGDASLSGQINQYYDYQFYSADRIYELVWGDSAFRNIGYWDESTSTQDQASERLVRALLDFIPDKRGRILDVACGLGASTRLLLEFYPARDVWAINISQQQIDSTLKNAPGCNALVMDAVDLSFDEGFFDNLICVEAALHFETRRKFLEEALRVLKPGGHLVMSDMLFASAERMSHYPIFPSPLNHIGSPNEYRELLLEVGFRSAEVIDVSRDVWRAHFLHHIADIHERFYDGKVNIAELTEIVWKYYHMNAYVGPWVFVDARK